MTKIQFYFDPGCPWCWNTSRWIKEVQKTQKVDVEWMSFSLAIKNGDSENKDYLDKFKKSQEMLRIIEAAKEKYNGKLTDALYTEFGIKIHNDKDFSDAAISEVLHQQRLAFYNFAKFAEWSLSHYSIPALIPGSIKSMNQTTSSLSLTRTMNGVIIKNV